MLHHLRTLAVLAALALGAITSGCGDGDRPVPAARSTTPTTHPRQSPSEYKGQLTLAAQIVETQIGAVGRARSAQALERRLGQASEALRSGAAELEGTLPPVGLDETHPALFAGLDGLADATDAARRATGAQKLCGAPSAIARLTQSPSARALRVTAQELRTVGYPVGGLAPQRRATPSRRLPNGHVLERTGAGSGTLTLQNGNGRDGVFKLVDPERRTVLTVYVRGHAEATVGGIPDGRYRAYMTIGRDWDGPRGTFTRDCEFERYARRAVYESTATTYTTYTISLHQVRGGESQTTPLEPRPFIG